jgi:hypothetical protein
MTDGQTPRAASGRRIYWYGRSRMNRWPLWASWLLAPSPHARQTVRELMQLRKAGYDV